ncbi:hypothetical protein COB21_00065 [Candidatus Aerophobetes bacterium]|uniref:Ribosomal RNA small subunit methyltransferase E n=1 Tax=Aerophobetes bacterium TaxID=2030807 RepID=A0A2A4X7X8_UNCAE|nr:MAG: hypothetical protein COB21_00065 [Candidatus Aerophobetes bacterium]
MPSNRFYLNGPLITGNEAILTSHEHHHLKNVIRKSVGSSVELINGKNMLATALISHIERNKTLLTVQSVETQKPHYPPFHLVLGLSHLSKVHIALEKCTELGVSHFTLVPMDLSKKNFIGPKDQVRCHQTIIGALKQCGRLDLPSLEILPNLDALKIPSHIDSVFFGDPRKPLNTLPSAQEKNILFFIGPDSGFSDEEYTLLEKQYSAKGVKLHQNILRFETAAIISTMLFLK